MRTEEELKAGWKLFCEKYPVLMQQGNAQSTFAFMRVDQLPDGGMTTSMIVYNLTERTHIGMLAYQLQSVHDNVQKGNSTEYKHSIARVLNLFNKLFRSQQHTTGLHSNMKKDLN